jgi:hypothetical protein
MSVILTLYPLSIKARSQTATSPANLLNSRTWVSSSVDHLLTISSMVLPLSIDGGGTATMGAVEVVAGASGFVSAVRVVRL